MHTEAPDGYFFLRIIGSTDAVATLHSELQDHYSVEPGEVPDDRELRLDVATAAALVALVPVVLTDQPLLPLLLDLLKRDRARDIVIDSPLGRVRFTPRAGMTEDEIREKIRQLGAII